MDSPSLRTSPPDQPFYLGIFWALAIIVFCVLLQISILMSLREILGKNLSVIVSLLLGLILPAVLIVLWISPNPKQTLRLNGISLAAGGWGASASLSFALVITLSLELILRLGVVPSKILVLLNQEEELMRELFSFQGFWNLFALVLAAALAAPLAEELLFRGLLQGSLERRLGNWTGLVVAGVVFGLLHGRVRFLPVGLLGVIMGYMVMRTNSVFSGALAHACNNSLAVAFAFVGHVERVSIGRLTSAIALGTAIFIFSMIMFHRATTRRPRIVKIDVHPLANWRQMPGTAGNPLGEGRPQSEVRR